MSPPDDTPTQPAAPIPIKRASGEHALSVDSALLRQEFATLRDRLAVAERRIADLERRLGPVPRGE